MGTTRQVQAQAQSTVPAAPGAEPWAGLAEERVVGRQLRPGVHFWDLDGTLVDNDCDASWKAFLIGRGLAPASDLEILWRFSQQYDGDDLDPADLNAFLLREFAGKTPEEMAPLAEEHFEEMVRPRVYPDALAAVGALKREGALVCLLTGVNRVVAAPVADFFGFEVFFPTELEAVAGRYTGRVAGTYRLGLGKVALIIDFCRRYDRDLTEVYYYGDSPADIPVLERVGHPVAVNPRPELRLVAVERGWPVVDFEAVGAGDGPGPPL